MYETKPNIKRDFFLEIIIKLFYYNHVFVLLWSAQYKQCLK